MYYVQFRGATCARGGRHSVASAPVRASVFFNVDNERRGIITRHDTTTHGHDHDNDNNTILV